jgi:hypothetical protein
MMPPSWNAEIKSTIEDALDSARESQKRDDHENISALAVPLTNLVNELKEYKQQQDTNDEKRSTRERVTIGAIIATAALTFLTLIVFKRQLGEMEKAYEPIRQSAAAAKTSADAAVAANITTRAQIRAFIAVPQKPGSQIKFSADGSITIKINFKNTGESIARSINIVVDVIMRPNDGFPFRVGNFTQFRDDVPKNDEFETEISTRVPNNQAGSILWNNFKSGGGIIFVRGKVNFVDIFGEAASSGIDLGTLFVRDSPLDQFLPLERRWMQ